MLLFLLAGVYADALVAEPVNARELDIEWRNNKISITAKGVTVCQVLEELAEKTNTTISNKNECGNTINLRVEKRSFDHAVREILRHDSYILVEDAKERKLIVYERNLNQSGNDTGAIYETESTPVYTPATTELDASQLTGAEQLPDSYQDPNYTGEPVATNMVELREPLPYPAEPPFNPEVLEYNAGAGSPIPDPSTTFLNPAGIPYP
ncbi:MAG: hypothetical protein L0Z73_03435 [Gammaproteobacteria bacterium]|nr:hypothetical protein [Gammaproteobacteria bacterium]